MRIGYFGTPEISARLLTTILESGRHEVAFVVSNPDKPVGRSKQPQPSPVSALALERGLPLFRFEKLRDGTAEAALAAHDIDLQLVFAYGRLLPMSICDRPPLRSLNLHTSLLPLLRGASPIQSALLEGFAESGVTLQYMEEGLDSGAVLDRREVVVESDDRSLELTGKLVAAGIELTLAVLDDFERYAAASVAQDESTVTWCRKIRPEDGAIDWSRPAAAIHNQVRALHQWPTASTLLNGERLLIHRSRLVAPDDAAAIGDGVAAAGHTLAPGQLAATKQQLFVGCGDGPLEIVELQPAGRKLMAAAAWLNGLRGALPERLGWGEL